MFKRFEALIKERNLKYSDVARGAGIPYSTITDWKAGRYTPKREKMQKIADYLNVNVDYLMGYSDIKTIVLSDDPLYRAARRRLEKDSSDEAAKRILFYNMLNQINPTEAEYALILAYRNASDGIKESVRKLLDISDTVQLEKKA